MSVAIDLQGKTALITGASQGIGAAIARLLHRAGADVRLNHPGAQETAADAARLAAELDAVRPGSATVHPADVSDPVAVQAMMAEAGPLDLLVNNAAILRDRTVANMTALDWEAVIDVDLKGVFHCCKFGLEVMREGGSIVSLGSISARAGFYGQANYAAAKAGVVGLTRVLSRECSKRRIRANVVAPGLVATAMTATIPPDRLEEMVRQIPARRTATPEEVASAVLFLCSDLASYVNGHLLEVDGGWRV